MSDASVSSTEPTSMLFASNKIDGTKVKSRDGDNLGTVYSLMINKRSGMATYAVLSLGGFLGIGKSYYPLPFELISYDHVADGYVVGEQCARFQPGVCRSRIQLLWRRASRSDAGLRSSQQKPEPMDTGRMN